MFRFWFSCYSHCFDILLACNISAMSYFTSLLEHCKCFPREDVFSIFSLGSVREIHSLGKYFSVHSLGHSEYQEIHTFSALIIDSVKINTSLLMMRECHFIIRPAKGCYGIGDRICYGSQWLGGPVLWVVRHLDCVHICGLGTTKFRWINNCSQS